MVQLLHMAAHRLWERRTRRAFVHAPAFVLALLCGGSVAATQAQWREHIHKVGIDVSPTQPSRLPPSRKQLLFNHNPKAGGSTLRKLFMKAVPDGSFNVVPEHGSSRLAEQQRAFVIGNVREPCEHYVSLWAFNSKGRGSFAHSADNATLGRDPPHYNSPGDVHRFQTWLRLENVAGVVTRRFLRSYGNRTHVDCWVFLDSLAASALGCLRQFEAQGGAVLWESPALVDLKEKEAARANELAEARASNGTLVAPRNRVHHGACSEYFDEGSTGLIVGGIDAALANAFGYIGCCGHVRSHGET